MSNKKYFWIKLKQDFFNDPYIKMLRRMAGGDTYTIIYLEMLVKSATSDGMLYFQGAGTDIAEELALTLGENVEDVRALLAYLEVKKLITHPEIREDVFLVASADLTGSETDSAQRVRKFRERQTLQSNALPLHSNSGVTTSNDKLEIELEIEKDNTVQKEFGRDDFEKLWKLYPRKEGKKVAYKAYQKAIKNGTTNKQIQDGIVAYKKMLASTERPADKVKMGSTWFNENCWEDEYETGGNQTSNRSSAVDHQDEISSLEQRLLDNNLTAAQRGAIERRIERLQA